MYVRSITDDKTKPPEDNLRITFIKVSKEQIRVRIQNSIQVLNFAEYWLLWWRWFYTNTFW